MNEKEKLFRTWGTYLGYPECCVDAFVERVKYRIPVPNYMATSVFRHSGFIPCECCNQKVQGLSLKEASDLVLGRNPFEDEITDPVKSYEDTLASTEDLRFVQIAQKFKFNLWSYRKGLESSLRKLQVAKEVSNGKRRLGLKVD